MNTELNKLTGKKEYSKPEVEKILLDNQISLAMQSLAPPPEGPDESTRIDKSSNKWDELC
jgi:hypothetical protein